MLGRIATVGAAVVMVFGITFPAAAAPAATGQPLRPAEEKGPPQPALDQAAPFDAAARRIIVAQIAKAMRNDYVEPAVGARAAAAIEAASAAGAYDSLQTPAVFAKQLTSDLFAVAHDKHIRVDAPGEPPSGDTPALPPTSDAGVVRADRLAGNIGYIELVAFPPPAALKGPLDRAMAALAGTRALIVDMRRNHGGAPLGVAYLVSFFVNGKAPVHVMDILWRKTGTTDYSVDTDFTSPTPTSYLDKPVYVLTSPGTFSGGEEFCYDMQSLKLGALVGETTGGGANPGGGRPLGSGLSIFMPTGKARSPVTGTNWEGVGVKPDITVPAGQALKAALRKLGQTPRSEDIADLSQASLFKLRTTPLPGTEAALRHMIEAAASGHPDYDQVIPAFADLVRSQAPVIDPLLAALGPIEFITFRGPSMIGGDSYEVRFARGAQFWSISLTPDGKVNGANFGPAPVTSAPSPPARAKTAPAT